MRCEEIAATFADAGLPDGFHQASAEVFRRLAGFKDAEHADLDAVLAHVERPAGDRPATR